MEFGAHLPLMDFGGHPYTIEHLVSYTSTAARLGFRTLAANDHLVFSVPWLDGPVALAAVMEHAGEMDVATTVSLPVVRGPIALAKALGAIDRLSKGRLIAAVGPGSSAEDYAAVGLDFSERWPRFDESIGALRALFDSNRPPLSVGSSSLRPLDPSARRSGSSGSSTSGRFWNEVRPLVSAA